MSATQPTRGSGLVWPLRRGDGGIGRRARRRPATTRPAASSGTTRTPLGPSTVEENQAAAATKRSSVVAWFHRPYMISRTHGAGSSTSCIVPRAATSTSSSPARCGCSRLANMVSQNTPRNGGSCATATMVSDRGVRGSRLRTRRGSGGRRCRRRRAHRARPVRGAFGVHRAAHQPRVRRDHAVRA